MPKGKRRKDAQINQSEAKAYRHSEADSPRSNNGVITTGSNNGVRSLILLFECLNIDGLILEAL